MKDPRTGGSDGRRRGSKNAFKGSAESERAKAAVGRAAQRWSFRRVLTVYAACCLVRLLHTAVVRSYFDPDEFWQTLEPAYCLAFGKDRRTAESDASYTDCPGFTWEWKRRYHNSTASSLLVHNTTNSKPPLISSLFANYVEPSLWGPVRSHLPILPTYLLYRLLRYLEWDTSYAVSRGPMLLNAVLVAAPVDVAVGYAASHLYSSQPHVAFWCLLASLLSWFNGYSLVRTFSNSQETALLAIAVALVAPELLLPSSYSSIQGPRSRNHHRRRACWAFYLGGLSTAIRFTALAAFVPMGLLLAHQSASSPCQQDPAQKNITARPRWFATFATYLLWPCAAFGLAGIATSVVLDRIMYGFWTVPFLGLIHFNVVLNYASLYGSHPWHWYFSAGLPAVAGLLLVPLLSMLLFKPGVVVGSTSPRAGVRNLWCILISYVAIMSFNGHKEFRYIHPVLPLVCLLTGPSLRSWAVGKESAAASPSPRRNQVRKVLVVALFGIANLVPVLYLGLFHQSGPVSVNRRIVEVAREAAAASPSSSTKPARFTVYYWTGECHSTPLHSHLHQPRHPQIEFDTWSLDCSPACRAELNNPIACETKWFQHDPAQFVMDALCRNEVEKNATSLAHGTDLNECRPAPDFVVTFSSYVRALDPVLRDRLGMLVVGRYPFHLRGAALSSRKGGIDHSHCRELGDGDMCNDIRASNENDDDVVVANARTGRSRRRVFEDAMGWTLDVDSDDVVLYSLVRPARPLGASGASLEDDEAAASAPAIPTGEL
jgi:GPI mannosyltransferase 3